MHGLEHRRSGAVGVEVAGAGEADAADDRAGDRAEVGAEELDDRSLVRGQETGQRDEDEGDDRADDEPDQRAGAGVPQRLASRPPRRARVEPLGRAGRDDDLHQVAGQAEPVQLGERAVDAGHVREQRADREALEAGARPVRCGRAHCVPPSR